jgi:hypothetical protein
MFHANTQRMIDHWRDLKGDAAAPARTAIDPGAFAHLLPQVVILGRPAAGRYVVRLAGGLVDEVHGGGLVGGDPIALWAEPYRASLELALEAIRRRPEPLVITAEGQTASGQALSLEIMLAPLTGASGEIDRLLGLYQPTSPVAALTGRPIGALVMRSIATARPDGVLPRLRLAAVDGRQIA